MKAAIAHAAGNAMQEIRLRFVNGTKERNEKVLLPTFILSLTNRNLLFTIYHLIPINKPSHHLIKLFFFAKQKLRLYGQYAKR